MAKRTESEKQAIDSAVASLPPRAQRNSKLKEGEVSQTDAIRMVQEQLRLHPPFDFVDYIGSLGRLRRSR